MPVWTRPLAGLVSADRPSVGGKCAGLGELVAAGADVPPGFAVTVDAFAAACAADGVGDRLSAVERDADPGHPGSLARAQAAAEGVLAGAALPAGLADEIRTAYAALPRTAADDPPVAVRSSAVAEDGADASLAGQQETYLHVVGADDVVAHVRRCWASLYAPRALASRRRLPAALARDARRIAVGVQVMVTPRVSGVAFTVSPRTGDRSVVAVNASWGLGQAVVAGEVTPDEYWLTKIGPALVRRTVAHKALRCVRAPDGRGVRTEPVPALLRDVPCLDDEDAVRLCRIVLDVERHLGAPQDIEWALVDDLADGTHQGRGRFVLLQSRPETTWRRALERERAATPSPAYLAVVQEAARDAARGVHRP